MIEKDIEYLKCIKCGSDFKLDVLKRNKGECIEGILRCVKCKSEWPVINGIPRILPEVLFKSLVFGRYPDFFKRNKIKFVSKKLSSSEKLKSVTADSFGFEWLKYPKILDQFEKDWARYFNPFIHKEDIQGKVVADFGCGMAKHGFFIGKYKAKKYIGVDLSQAVEAAYINTKQFKPLIVQADIYNLPLKGEKIDLHYSIGVLHHLPDPEKGFQSIVKLMKKGSKIFIWVYGKRKNARALLLYNPIRTITTRMPKGILYPLCHLPAATVHAINAAQKGMSKVGLKKVAGILPFDYYKDFPYHFKVSDSFDVFGTPKQVYYEMDEIKKWFKNVKLDGAKLEHDIVQGIKGFGIKR